MRPRLHPAVISPLGVIHVYRRLQGRSGQTLCGTSLQRRRFTQNLFMQGGWVLLHASFEHLNVTRKGSKICRYCEHGLGD